MWWRVDTVLPLCVFAVGCCLSQMPSAECQAFSVILSAGGTRAFGDPSSAGVALDGVSAGDIRGPQERDFRSWGVGAGVEGSFAWRPCIRCWICFSSQRKGRAEDSRRIGTKQVGN